LKLLKLLKLLQLFIAFGRVGVLGYGGGPSSIPLVQIEVVENYKWLTIDEFSQVLAIGNALPGPIATKMAGYIGYKVAGLPGAFMAVLGMIGPSLFVMLLLYNIMSVFNDLPQIKGMIKAIKPVVIILLGLLIWDMIPNSLTNYTAIAIAALSLVLIQFLKIHPAIVVVMALAYGGFFIR
jgi:chromate transporter